MSGANSIKNNPPTNPLFKQTAEGGEKSVTPEKGLSPSPSAFPLRVWVTEDKLALMITGQLGTLSEEELVSGLQGECERAGLSDADMLHRILQQFLKLLHVEPRPTEFVDVPLLEGRAPVMPQHGRIEWADDFFNTGFEIDPHTGAADYRRRSAKVVVSEGQLLATILPPVEGGSGQDIFGRMIAAPKPKSVRVRVGANVRYDEEEDAYYALKDGRIRYVNEMLHVDDVYEVSGNVDLKVGNIKHPGAVIILGNVEPESIVEADGDVEIHGYVEDAEIYTGGNLVVHSGISGGAHHIIRAKGTIHGKFINNVDIEAGDNVYVDREVDQTIVKTRGALHVAGRIVGGQVIALAGIEADETGSEACVRTLLIAGDDYTLREKIIAKENELAARKESLEKICERLLPFRDKCRQLPPKLRTLVQTLAQESTKIREAIHVLESELTVIRAESKDRLKREVLIHKRICPESIFQLMGLTLHVREFVPGPIKVAIRDGDIRLVQTRAH